MRKHHLPRCTKYCITKITQLQGYYSWLGQRGLFTTSSGLQIAYLAGAYDKKNFSVTDSESGRGEANLVSWRI